jgi:hypothetical protein
MGRFKDFISNSDYEDDSDYRKHDGKREKKNSWKDEARKKRQKRYDSDDDEGDHEYR